MGHHLDAFVLRGPFNEARAREFDMRWVALPYELTMFLVIDDYIDDWADKLGIHGGFAKPIYNFHVIHHMMRTIADDPLFAVIETDYFGGVGGQCAAVYRGNSEILAPGATINEALRTLGVKAAEGEDEFDTIGLANYRNGHDLFGDGYDD